MKQDASNLSKKNILIVDDEPDTCQLLSALFGLDGYISMIAGSGEEALKQVSLSRPDIVVLNEMMPDVVESFRFSLKL